MKTALVWVVALLAVTVIHFGTMYDWSASQIMASGGAPIPYWLKYPCKGFSDEKRCTRVVANVNGVDLIGPCGESYTYLNTTIGIKQFDEIPWENEPAQKPKTNCGDELCTEEEYLPIFRNATKHLRCGPTWGEQQAR